MIMSKLLLGAILAVAAALSTPALAGTSLDSPTTDYWLTHHRTSHRFVPPKASSLPRAPIGTNEWRSGGKSNLADLASLRGNPIDIEHVHLIAPSFDRIATNLGPTGWVTGVFSGKPAGYGALLSIALLPSDNAQDFAGCNAGTYDGKWLTIATNVQANFAGKRFTAVEPGWEPNLGSHSHPWGWDTYAESQAWKACWARVAG